MASYLDKTGLGILWAKIKAYVDSHSGGVSGDYLPLTGGDLSGNLRLNADSGVGRWTVTRQNDTSIMSSGVNTAGLHGLFSDKGSRWIIRASADGSHVTINDGASSTTDVDGTLTLEGHDSPIGTVVENKASSSTVVPSGSSYKAVCSITLPAGVWVIRAFLRIPTMGTDRSKYVQANFSSTSGDSGYYFRMPCENMITETILTQIVQLSSTTTYYLNVNHNSGSDKTFVTGSTTAQNMRAVRIA